MRSDMTKVLLTRPRRGGGNAKTQPNWNNGIGNRLRGHLDDLEDYEIDLPKHEGMHKRYGWDHKSQSWYNAPLEGFIRKSVGRPWNDVYSEICSGLKGKIGLRLRERLDWLVELHAVMEDEVPYVRGSRYRLNSFYVDPTTGILCEAPQERRWYQRDRKSRKSDDFLKEIEPNHWLQKLEGVWYDLGSRTRVKNDYYYLNGRDPDQYVDTYEYKHQLNRKELRLYGLQNG